MDPYEIWKKLSRIKDEQKSYLAILKFKDVNFTTIKINRSFLEDMNIDNTLISDKIFSGENNYKYLIDYKDDVYKIKTLSLILPKSSTYVKSYDFKTKWM